MNEEKRMKNEDFKTQVRGMTHSLRAPFSWLAVRCLLPLVVFVSVITLNIVTTETVPSNTMV